MVEVIRFLFAENYVTRQIRHAVFGLEGLDRGRQLRDLRLCLRFLRLSAHLENYLQQHCDQHGDNRDNDKRLDQREGRSPVCLAKFHDDVSTACSLSVQLPDQIQAPTMTGSTPELA